VIVKRRKMRRPRPPRGCRAIWKKKSITSLKISGVNVLLTFTSSRKRSCDYYSKRGTKWRSWLGQCATSQKVAGSIPDEIIVIFHWLNPSGLSGVDSTSNRNEYQDYFLGGKGGRCIWLTNLPSSCADCLEIWRPQPPGTLRPYPGLCRDSFIFY
jgi:hypothetical protein